MEVSRSPPERLGKEQSNCKLLLYTRRQSWHLKVITKLMKWESETHLPSIIEEPSRIYATAPRAVGDVSIKVFLKKRNKQTNQGD